MGQRKNNVHPPGWELKRCKNSVRSPDYTSFGFQTEKIATFEGLRVRG